MSAIKIVSSEASLAIEAPDECCYHFWRNFEAFPNFMHNIKSVKHIRDNVWQWTLLGKYGDESVWEFSLEKEIPHKLISWRSVSSPDMDVMVDISFQPLHAHETLVSIDLSIYPPSIPTHDFLQEMHGLTEKDLERNLEEVKAIIECQHEYADSPSEMFKSASYRE